VERINGAIALPGAPAEVGQVTIYDLEGECVATDQPGTELAVRELEPEPFVPVYPGARVNGPRDAFSTAGNFSLAVGPVWPEI
jgi:hypothetical protein